MAPHEFGASSVIVTSAPVAASIAGAPLDPAEPSPFGVERSLPPQPLT
jgi:hypothetical protein